MLQTNSSWVSEIIQNEEGIGKISAKNTRVVGFVHEEETYNG